jgi:hypothetical protein
MMIEMAFAKVNCTTTSEGVTCSGGESNKGSVVPGGSGGHTSTATSGELSRSGGFGGNDPPFVGGGGRFTCDSSGCQFVGR